jgi:hypothetical protein
MADSVLIALIVTVGAIVTAIGWKVLDIGKRAVELERLGRHDPASSGRSTGD